MDCSSSITFFQSCIAVLLVLKRWNVDPARLPGACPGPDHVHRSGAPGDPGALTIRRRGISRRVAESAEHGHEMIARCPGLRRLDALPVAGAELRNVVDSFREDPLRG